MRYLFYVVVAAFLFVLCQSEINISVKGTGTTLKKIPTYVWKIPKYVWKIPTYVWNRFWNFYYWFFCHHCSSENTCPEPVCPATPACPETETPPTCPGPECPTTTEESVKFVDCADALQRGEQRSGVYTIWPKTLSTSLDVYCDMRTDGGGWTLIQQRDRYSTPKDYFYKDWESYKTGFGDINEEFWLGNDNIHAISKQADTTIRFDLTAANGVPGYAQYDSFWIDDETSNYALHIDGYSGDVGDSMEKSANMLFTTNDRKNDLLEGDNCAVKEQGAWWYNSCGDSNLNGLYQPGVPSEEGMYWFTWKNSFEGLQRTEIKIRPKRS